MRKKTEQVGRRSSPLAPPVSSECPCYFPNVAERPLPNRKHRYFSVLNPAGLHWICTLFFLELILHKGRQATWTLLFMREKKHLISFTKVQQLFLCCFFVPKIALDVVWGRFIAVRLVLLWSSSIAGGNNRKETQWESKVIKSLSLTRGRGGNNQCR